LELRGLIETHKGIGPFVKKGARKKSIGVCREILIPRFFETVQEAKAAGMGEKWVVEFIGESYTSDSGLYGETPPTVRKLAKGR